MTEVGQSKGGAAVQWRQYLVLLGLICQGLACEQWLLPLLLFVGWHFALRHQRPGRFMPESIEVLVLAIVLAAAYELAPFLNIVWFASVGNALVLYQALRLLRPLEARERAFTIAVALTQVAIGAQTVFGYHFTLLLAAALVLTPLSLLELEATRFGEARPSVSWAREWRAAAWLFSLMVVFFLFFPRSQMNPLTARFAMRRGPQLPELDAAASVDDPSAQLVFRVEGKQVGYLRCFALDTFDGRSWTATPKMFRERRRPYSADRSGARYRSVKIVAPRVLRNVLPVDGHVVHVQGNYTQWPYVAEHEGLLVPLSLRRKVAYEYWSHPRVGAGELDESQRLRYLQLPAVSPELVSWLDTALQGIAGAEEQAAALTSALQSDYSYELGGPDLSQEAPLEDFLLRTKAGHCGRFASVLAVLLRVRGIPSRVVMGYLPVELNALGGFYNVRLRHAHAWTEAWLPGRGWTMFDATPFGAELPVERRRLSLTLYEWIEYVWYNKIVEFGSTDQLRLADGVSNVLHAMVQAAWRLWGYVFGAAAASVGLMLLWRGRKRRPKHRRSVRFSLPGKHSPQVDHFYGRMLRVLSRRRLLRRPDQTPLEFLDALKSAQYQHLAEAGFITRTFCRVRYGASSLSSSLCSALARALRVMASRGGGQR